MDSDSPGAVRMCSGAGASPGALAVLPGQYVIVRLPGQVDRRGSEDWWMGQILFREGDDQQSAAPSLLRVWDVDSGDIRLIRADLIAHVVHGLDGLGQESWISREI